MAVVLGMVRRFRRIDRHPAHRVLYGRRGVAMMMPSVRAEESIGIGDELGPTAGTAKVKIAPLMLGMMP
ncbi:hypothetical protein ABC347_17910 [Sphingomonas sp. 1P06PA]